MTDRSIPTRSLLVHPRSWGQGMKLAFAQCHQSSRHRRGALIHWEEFWAKSTTLLLSLRVQKQTLRICPFATAGQMQQLGLDALLSGMGGAAPEGAGVAPGPRVSRAGLGPPMTAWVGGPWISSRRCRKVSVTGPDFRFPGASRFPLRGRGGCCWVITWSGPATGRRSDGVVSGGREALGGAPISFWNWAAA